LDSTYAIWKNDYILRKTSPFLTLVGLPDLAPTESPAADSETKKRIFILGFSWTASSLFEEIMLRKPALLPEIQVRLDERATRPSLTPREVQVTELVGRGLRNKEIATELHISEETVQVHVKSILTKLGVNDRTAAVNVAMRRGIIHLAQ